MPKDLPAEPVWEILPTHDTEEGPSPVTVLSLPCCAQNQQHSLGLDPLLFLLLTQSHLLGETGVVPQPTQLDSITHNHSSLADPLIRHLR